MGLSWDNYVNYGIIMVPYAWNIGIRMGGKPWDNFMGDYNWDIIILMH